MKATCPDCGAQGHLSAFFSEEDGKRFAALLLDMQPELARASFAYLGLFKPRMTSLRLPRAIKLLQELAALASTGTVCRDERNGVRRPITPSMWAAAIEIMLAQRASLVLPLENHNYLRAVAFGLADKADANVERQREAQVRSGAHRRPAQEYKAESPLETQLAWIRQQVGYGKMTEEEAETARDQAHEKFGGQDG